MDASSRSFSPEELLAEADWVWGLARSLVGDRDAAEDVVQETWLAALQRRPLAGRPLRPWLARVLRNQAALRARRRGRTERDRERVQEQQASTADLVARAEMQRRLVGVVLELEEPYRSVVLRRFYDDLTPAAIARQRGVPAATVRTQLHRALAQLRAALDRESDRRVWSLALASAARLPRSSERALLAGAPALALAVVAVAALALLALSWRSRVPRRGPLASAEPAIDATSPLARPALAGERTLALPEPPLRGPLSGRIVDERTHEPLPHFEVELVDGAGGTARARTDAHGRFATDAALCAGEYEIRLIDHPAVRAQDAEVHGAERVRSSIPSARAFLAPDGADVAIPCPAGPTYRLRMELPAGLETEALFAHLESPGQFRTRNWELHLAPVRPAPEDGGPWVRFGDLYTKFLDDDPPWVLSVGSSDGLWFASAEVRSIIGVYPETVELELRPCGIVSGSVRDEYGPVFGDLAIVLGSGAGELHRDSTREDGSFSFPRVEPGRYDLTTESPRHVPAPRTIEVRAGEPTTCNVQVERLPIGGAVQGTLASRSGKYSGSVILVLVPRARRGGSFFETVSWRETEAGIEGDFTFEDVPRGPYELRIVSCTDHLEWLPQVHEVEPPASLRLECRDDVPRCDLGFRVVDARDASELSQITIAYRGAGGMARLQQEDPERAGDDPRTGAVLWSFSSAGFTWTYVPGPYPIRGFPEGGSLEWMVSVPGYRPAYGDQSAFREQEPGQRVRRADVALHPGWGLQLAAVDATATPPQRLPGVLVSADGRALGRTGPDGTIRIELEARPRRLDIEHATLRFVAGDLEPGDPPARIERSIYEVRLAGPGTDETRPAALQGEQR